MPDMLSLVQTAASQPGFNDDDTPLSMNPDDSLPYMLYLVKRQQAKIALLLATGDIVNRHGIIA